MVGPIRLTVSYVQLGNQRGKDDQSKDILAVSDVECIRFKL